MNVNSFQAGMALTVFGFALVTMAGGCSSSGGDAKTPDFWGSKAATYTTMSTTQQAQASQVATDLSKIIQFARNSGSDASDLVNYGLTITAPTTGDSVTVPAIAADCQYRSQEVKDPTGQSTTFSMHEWFDDSATVSCPVTLELSGSTTTGGGAAGNELHTLPAGHGGVNVGNETHTTLDYTLAFTALPGTTVFTQGTIRSVTLAHHEESYQLTRNAAIPNMEGRVSLIKSVTGTIVLTTGDVVPFTIVHSTDYHVLPIDDSTTANAGRDLQEIDMKLPFGHAAVRVDSQLNGKLKGSVTTTYINGAIASQKTQ